MNIAIVTRNCVPIPPNGYGGTERVLYDLTEEFIRLGHTVYLFCKKGSKTSANMIYYDDNIDDDHISNFVLDKINEYNLKIDIIHDNSEALINDKYYHNKFKDIPICFTLHYASKYNYEYKETIYPSFFIRNVTNGIDDLDNVIYHGINVSDYVYNENKDNYLLYMGIIKYNKGVHHAIEVSKKTGIPLIMVGPQDDDDENLEYFNTFIKPELNEKIQYLGEVAGNTRIKLLSYAKALVFPTRIETFGLVSVEAMASGTPCLFLNNCTEKELLGNKFNQCICNDVDEMVDIILKNKLPNSLDLRNHIENNFSVNKMAKHYLKCYNDLITQGEYENMQRKKNTISLCMIAKNEEKNIENCLKSVYDLVDEIIVVDTGSTDKTKEVALKYGAKVYDFEWIYDFSAARNYSLQFATCDYIFFLDCDDMLKEKDREEFKKVKETMDGSIDLYWMYYDYRHDNNGNSNYSFLTERIFKNFQGIHWECVIHEMLQVKHLYNNAEKTKIRITHTSNHDNTDKYLDFFKKNEEIGHEFNDREKFFYSMELFKHNEFEKCLKYSKDIANNDNYYSMYERSAAAGMVGYIEKENRNYFEAIKYFLLAGFYHQPLPKNYYEIADCYRALRMYDYAFFYYNTLLADGTFFKENFYNESVYTNFEEDLKKARIDSLLSMILIYYNDLKDIEKAEECNNKLLEIDPNNDSGLYNKAFFDSLKEGKV